MDQLFDRFERLIKSWVNASSGSSALRSEGRAKSQRSGNTDLDAAMAELDDYLDDSRTDTERREAQARMEKADRERREREARAKASNGRPNEADKRAALAEAYRFLGLPNNAPFADVKAAYKKLLFKYHPDRNSGSPESLARATELSARINAAYQLIEAWMEASTAKHGQQR